MYRYMYITPCLTSSHPACGWNIPEVHYLTYTNEDIDGYVYVHVELISEKTQI